MPHLDGSLTWPTSMISKSSNPVQQTLIRIKKQAQAVSPKVNAPKTMVKDGFAWKLNPFNKPVFKGTDKNSLRPNSRVCQAVE